MLRFNVSMYLNMSFFHKVYFVWLPRAFSRLKTTLPWVPADTKLSKLDTLRLASSYISHLAVVLKDEQEKVGLYVSHLAVVLKDEQEKVGLYVSHLGVIPKDEPEKI